jgi:hypothetical protein
VSTVVATPLTSAGCSLPGESLLVFAMIPTVAID